MRVLVCGNRDWTDDGEIAYHLALIFGAARDRIVIHGGNGRVEKGRLLGADIIAGWCAKGVGASVEVFSADTAIDGPWPGADPRRNERMLRNGRPDRGLAFGALWNAGSESWNPAHQTGTGDMTRRMLRVGLPVRWIRASGVDYVDLTEMPRP